MEQTIVSKVTFPVYFHTTRKLSVNAQRSAMMMFHEQIMLRRIFVYKYSHRQNLRRELNSEIDDILYFIQQK